MQNWEGKFVFNWNRLSRNKMWCASDNHNNMCHICAKELLDLKPVNINCPQFYIFTKIIIFFKYNWIFLDQPLLPYKFHSSDMWGMYFFIFASCEPFIQQYTTYIHLTSHPFRPAPFRKAVLLSAFSLSQCLGTACTFSITSSKPEGSTRRIIKVTDIIK